MVQTIGLVSNCCLWLCLPSYSDQKIATTDFLSHVIKDPAAGISVLHIVKDGFMQKTEHCRCSVYMFEVMAKLLFEKENKKVF